MLVFAQELQSADLKHWKSHRKHTESTPFNRNPSEGNYISGTGSFQGDQEPRLLRCSSCILLWAFGSCSKKHVGQRGFSARDCRAAPGRQPLSPAPLPGPFLRSPIGRREHQSSRKAPPECLPVHSELTPSCDMRSAAAEGRSHVPQPCACNKKHSCTSCPL